VSKQLENENWRNYFRKGTNSLVTEIKIQALQKFKLCEIESTMIQKKHITILEKRGVICTHCTA